MCGGPVAARELCGPWQGAAPLGRPDAPCEAGEDKPQHCATSELLGESGERVEGTEGAWRSESDIRGVCRADPWG